MLCVPASHTVTASICFTPFSSEHGSENRLGFRHWKRLEIVCITVIHRNKACFSICRNPSFRRYQFTAQLIMLFLWFTSKIWPQLSLMLSTLSREHAIFLPLIRASLPFVKLWKRFLTRSRLENYKLSVKKKHKHLPILALLNWMHWWSIYVWKGFWFERSSTSR